MIAWRTGSRFTPDEDAILKGMLKAGKTRREIQKTLNRSKSSVESRIVKLRLQIGPARAYTYRSDLPPVRACEVGKPLDLGEGDARYVRACLAQGGFRYRAILPDGTTVEVRP